MLLNKEERIKYLGFNDTRFMLIGIVVLSFVTDYMFNNSFAKYPLKWALFSWSISLFFAACDWLILRGILIRLRKRFPALKDDRKRIGLFFISIVTVVTGVDLIGGSILELLLGGNFNYPERLKVIIPVIIVSTMTMAIYEAVYYYLRLKESIRKEEQSKQAIVQAQLDVLRNQAQPHFFFNSLNTLRDIIDHNSKEEAKTFVDKLAEVYRFVLQTGKQNLIALEEEMDFAKAYVHIQKERFGANLQLDWDASITEKRARVVPTSLQLLIENAIKHNVVSKSKPLQVRVYQKDEQLVIENKIQPKSTQIASTKLGLNNLRERYDILADTPLKISDTDGYFRVFIPLLTSQNQADEDSDRGR